MRLRNAALITIMVTVVLSAQVISFNSPVAWTTQRNDSIVVRAQIDTAQVKKKSISIAVSEVVDGKKRQVSSKSFPVKDYSGEFSFGTIKRNLIGGTNFLRIDWSIGGTQEKGTIAPIGIINFESLPKIDPIAVVHVKDNASAEDVAKAVTQFTDANFAGFGLSWNKQALHVVIRIAKTDSGTIKVALDGKNGKNAFLSYPDRIINYAPLNDSVWGSHFVREWSNETIAYLEKKWDTEITHAKVGDVVVVTMPWHDSGIIPFDGRIAGFAVFITGNDTKQVSSVPASARFFIPGTWGEIKLSQ